MIQIERVVLRPRCPRCPRCFDCCHSGDLAPEMGHLGEAMSAIGGAYRDMSYVRREVESLARQIVEPKA